MYKNVRYPSCRLDSPLRPLRSGRNEEPVQLLIAHLVCGRMMRNSQADWAVVFRCNGAAPQDLWDTGADHTQFRSCGSLNRGSQQRKTMFLMDRPLCVAQKLQDTPAQCLRIPTQTGEPQTATRAHNIARDYPWGADECRLRPLLQIAGSIFAIEQDFAMRTLGRRPFDRAFDSGMHSGTRTGRSGAIHGAIHLPWNAMTPVFRVESFWS